MILRLIVIDPAPPLGKSDMLVYQVPENSREMKLLVKLLTDAGIEWVSVSAPRQPKRKEK